MEYPRKLQASVLLLDGKIMNWAIGKNVWSCVREAVYYNQNPITMGIYLRTGEERLVVKQTSVIVNNRKEDNEFFAETAREFINEYKYHEIYKGAEA